MLTRSPGPVAFERQNHIGLLDVRFRSAWLVQTMAVREVHVRGTAVEDRQVQRFGKADQVRHGGWIFTNHTRDGDRVASLDQRARRTLYHLWSGYAARWRHTRVGSISEASTLLGDDFAWQGEIDWPLGLATGESEGTVDDTF